MRCKKCEGFMSYEKFYPPRENWLELPFWGWRCIYCGDIIDDVIIGHRIKQGRF